MLDPQVDGVRLMVDRTAERIATLGGEPNGLPGTSSPPRLGRLQARPGHAPEHLGALDVVYSGVIEEHRQAIDEFEELDPVSQDMLIEQAQDLEQYQWFVRAHLESAEGAWPPPGCSTPRRRRPRRRRRHGADLVGLVGPRTLLTRVPEGARSATSTASPRRSMRSTCSVALRRSTESAKECLTWGR